MRYGPTTKRSTVAGVVSESLFLLPNHLMRSYNVETIKVKLIDQNSNSLFNSLQFGSIFIQRRYFFIIWFMPIRIPMFLFIVQSFCFQI